MDLDDERIDRLDRKRDRQRMKNKRKTEERAAVGGIFDKLTLETINRFYQKNVLEEFIGIISAGKEASVYFAYGENRAPRAVKIYKLDPQNTKWMKNYIIGDPRFTKIGATTNKIIFTWCKKEQKNLMQMIKAGIRVPKPIIAMNNVLIMEFIGSEDGSPAPRLKDVTEIADPEKIYEQIIHEIRTMYLKAHLVHGDLSEFNILYWEERPIIIDVSQAVSIEHIHAGILLERDLKNIGEYFKPLLGEEKIRDAHELSLSIMRDSKS
jgi:RIO kinase 1